MASAAGMEGMLVMLHTQNAASGGEDGAATSEVISLCACSNQADFQKPCDYSVRSPHPQHASLVSTDASFVQGKPRMICLKFSHPVRGAPVWTYQR